MSGRSLPHTQARSEAHFKVSGSPDARNRLAAVLALTLVQLDRFHDVTLAFHYDATALGAIGALGRVTGHVSDVDVMKSFAVGNRLGPIESLQRRRREVLQEVLRVEA